MKKGMMGIVLVLLGHCCAAQTFDEWWRQKQTQLKYYTDQLAALQVYSALLQKGYSLVREGWEQAGGIQQEDLDQHGNYFASLRRVNAAIGESKKPGDGRAMYASILRQCRQGTAWIPLLSSDQQVYARAVLQGLLRLAQEQWDEYNALSADGQYALSDAERWGKLDAALEELHHQSMFAQHMLQQLQALLRQREQEAQDRQSIYHMYQPD